MGNAACCTSNARPSEMSVLSHPSVTDANPFVQDKSEAIESCLIVPLITKIEALWLGFTTRRQLLHVRKLAVRAFFPQSEARETLSRSPPSGKRSKIHRYMTGSKYEGEWLGGFRHGFGIHTFPGGETYEGNWDFGIPFGQGKFSYPDGDSFEGVFAKYFISIKDVFKCKTDLAKWKDLVLDGYSNIYTVWVWISEELKKAPTKKFVKKKLSFEPEENSDEKPPLVSLTANIKCIKIDIEKLKKAALTILRTSSLGEKKFYASHKYPNGNEYTGEWNSNLKEGRGKFLWANGDYYEGEWCHDQQSGLGKQIWASGNEYVGFFYKDMRHGIGEFLWKNGNKYYGQWKTDNMHGIGKHYWPDGRKYKGFWKAGVRDGFGVMKYANSTLYQGEFKNGKPEGYGVLFRLDNTQIKGTWEQGKLVHEH